MPISTATATASETFLGLTQKLDYLQRLGINCLWLMPFYPSPLHDDGYDIAYYTDVHPSYGTLADFGRFIEEAHAPGPPRHHGAGDEPHLGPASVVPAGAPGAGRIAGAGFLCVE